MIQKRSIDNTQTGMIASYSVINGNGYQSFMKLNSNDTISSLNQQMSVELISVIKLKPKPNVNMISIFT